MTVLGLLLVGLAAGLHVFIFYLESLAWTSGRARAIFGTSKEGAAATRELAFNQGFYNLFLAVMVGLGIVLHVLGHTAVGNTLIFAGAGSMLAASLVLLASSRDKSGAAIRQGFFPLLGLLALGVGLVL